MRTPILALVVVSILSPPAPGQGVKVQHRPNPAPAVGQVVYLHRLDGAPVLVATELGAMEDLMEFLRAGDDAGIRDLLARGRLVKVADDTPVKVINRDTVLLRVPVAKASNGRAEAENELVEVPTYRARILSGPCKDKIVWTLPSTTFDRREVAAKKKRGRR